MKTPAGFLGLLYKSFMACFPLKKSMVHFLLIILSAGYQTYTFTYSLFYPRLFLHLENYRFLWKHNIGIFWQWPSLLVGILLRTQSSTTKQPELSGTSADDKMKPEGNGKCTETGNNPKNVMNKKESEVHCDFSTGCWNIRRGHEISDLVKKTHSTVPCWNRLSQYYGWIWFQNNFDLEIQKSE